MHILKTISKYLAVALSILLLAGSVFSHPGHGSPNTDAWGAPHHLVSLQHLAPIVAVVFVVIVLLICAHRSKRTDER